MQTISTSILITNENNRLEAKKRNAGPITFPSFLLHILTVLPGSFLTPSASCMGAMILGSLKWQLEEVTTGQKSVCRQRGKNSPPTTTAGWPFSRYPFHHRMQPRIPIHGPDFRDPDISDT